MGSVIEVFLELIISTLLSDSFWEWRGAKWVTLVSLLILLSFAVFGWLFFDSLLMGIICGAIGFLIGLILFFFVEIIVDWPNSRETLRELWVGHREVPALRLATVDELMQEIEWCLRHGGEFVWTDPGSYTIDSYNPQYFLIHERYQKGQIMIQINVAEQAIETNLIDTKDTSDNRFKRRAYHIVPEINQG